MPAVLVVARSTPLPEAAVDAGVGGLVRCHQRLQPSKSTGEKSSVWCQSHSFCLPWVLLQVTLLEVVGYAISLGAFAFYNYFKAHSM